MADANQAHVDPEKLHVLSTDLSRLAGKIEQMENDLRGALAQLGRTFRDEEYDRFKELFLSSSQRLSGFVEAIRRLTPSLDRDAEELIAAQSIKPEI
jgi:uncharacterized protein YukE